MKKVSNLFLVITISLFACNNQGHSHDADHKHDSGHEHAVSAAESHSHDAETAVQLDHGKKWKANPETIDGIRKMSMIVRNGLIAKATPDQLHEPLKKEFQTIFDKCTMTGEAHEQLHHFLLPVKENLEEISKPSAGNSELEKLENYLLTFNNYFE